MSTYELAYRILGEDCISADEVMLARGVQYTKDQLIELECNLPDQATLEWCQNNGTMLVPGPPITMSLLDIRSVNANFFRSKGPEAGDCSWYDLVEEKFATTDKAEALAWIAIRKEPIEDSFSKNWSEQQALVADPLYVPNITEAVWALTTYKAIRHVYLLEDRYVRTSSVDMCGNHVQIGNFFAGQLHIDYEIWDNERIPCLGIWAARRF